MPRVIFSITAKSHCKSTQGSFESQSFCDETFLSWRSAASSRMTPSLITEHKVLAERFDKEENAVHHVLNEHHELRI